MRRGFCVPKNPEFITSFVSALKIHRQPRSQYNSGNFSLGNYQKLCDLDHNLCPLCHLLVRTNNPSKFEGPIPKHCQIIKLFSTKGSGDLDLCPQDHLLVRTNISTRFEGPNHKHCRNLSVSGTKGQGNLDL